ncbi:MAG TPA: NmrA family NAD(P)-binding protein, partial [Nitrospiraceae bacterium]|nr:NmrA family NAD(P)-binding protein [Nitrospiraceae bacterium]
GVEHYVYSSVASADRHTGIPHFESKWKIEQHIRESGLPATILRPAFFMENFSAPWMRPSIMEGTLALPLRPAKKLQMVAVHDLGEFAAAAFLRPEEFIGRTIELAGDELTMPEVAEDLSRTMGRPVAFRQLGDDEAEKAYGPDMARMYRWMNDTGFAVDIAALRERYGIPLMTFEQVIATAEWAKGSS